MGKLCYCVHQDLPILDILPQPRELRRNNSSQYVTSVKGDEGGGGRKDNRETEHAEFIDGLGTCVGV
jgi:hypothetical protein